MSNQGSRNESVSIFAERLSHVLGGRRRTPWGERLGSNKGTVYRMFQGEIPRWETLCAIQRVENVSLSWLLTGAGSPFLVHCAPTDPATAAWLGSQLAEFLDWTMYLVPGSADGRCCLILTRSASFEARGKTVPYTRVELLAGIVGPRTRARMRDATPAAGLRLLALGPRDFERLAAGELGTWSLLGEPEAPGLVADARSADPDELASAGREYARPPPEWVATALDAAADPLCHNVGRLSAANQQVVRSTVEALLRSEGQLWEEPGGGPGPRRSEDNPPARTRE